MKIDESIERTRKILTPEQTAKFLILMEKFKSEDKFSVFNLWNIKKVKKEDMVMRTVNFNKSLEEGQEKADQEFSDGADEALPNDEDDLYK